MTKTILLSTILLISGCSNLTTEQTLLGGTLAIGAASTFSETDNYGTTHALISYGIIKAAEEFADSTFSRPEQEWIADSVVTLAALGTAAHWNERESLNTFDSKMDLYVPLGVSISKLWERWTKEQ